MTAFGESKIDIDIKWRGMVAEVCGMARVRGDAVRTYGDIGGYEIDGCEVDDLDAEVCFYADKEKKCLVRPISGWEEEFWNEKENEVEEVACELTDGFEIDC